VTTCAGISFQPAERGPAGAEEGLPCPINQGLLPTIATLTSRLFPVLALNVELIRSAA
jgi:hypothetical protein